MHVRFDEFELDEANARLMKAGSPIALAPTPFGLLCALVRRSGSLLTKHALLDAVWGHRFVSDSVLKGAISDIRTALGDDPRSPRFIETVPRRGYRFVAAPSAVTADVTLAPVAIAPSSRGVPRSVVAPTRSREAASAAFVGREAELAVLDASWESACDGSRVVAWVAGEPGIGKTALIEHFVAQLGDVACARGQCVQGFGAGEPYHAVLEALGALARSDASVAPLLRSVAPTWLLQLPWLSTEEQREALRREMVGVNPERMLREMGEFLDRYTEERPLLLVTEDLHWSDRATTQLIDYVARRRAPARLMWLSSFRLAEVVALEHPLDALRHELRMHGLCVDIVLDAFTEREIANYLDGRAPHLARDESFVRALNDRTEGVPLFVASVVNDVASRLPGGATAAAELMSIPVPRSLSALIDHYLGRLDPGGRALLTAAAICGTQFRVDTLARVLDRDAVDVSDACEALVRGHLWIVAAPQSAATTVADGVQFAFRHALYREALVDRTSAAARVELHRRVAGALELERAAGVAIPASELAAHFEQGREPLKAVRYYAEAADTALRQLRPQECLALTERGLQLLDSAVAGPEWVAHEVMLATLRGMSAFHVLGAGTVARAAFARAAARLGDVPDHPMRGLLLHGQGFLLSLRAEYDEALLTAARAEALGDASGDALLVVAAGTVQGQVHNVQGRPEATRRALERALPAMDSLTAASESRLLGFIADLQVTARGLLGLALVNLGLVHQGREQLDAALGRARDLGQPMAIMVAIWFDALFEIRLGDVDRVEELATEMQVIVNKYSLAQGRTACEWFQGWADARRGRPLDGFRRIRDACDENIALGMVSGATENLSYAAEALVAAGDLDAAQAQLDEAFTLVERHDERTVVPQLRLIEAAIARGRHDPDRARNAILESIAESRAQGALWLELLGLVDLAEYGGANTDELSVLTALVARLDEAQDTRAVARARALLKAKH